MDQEDQEDLSFPQLFLRVLPFLLWLLGGPLRVVQGDPAGLDVPRKVLLLFIHYLSRMRLFIQHKFYPNVVLRYFDNQNIEIRTFRERYSNLQKLLLLTLVSVIVLV